MTPALALLALALQSAPAPAAPALDQLWLLRAGDEACTFLDGPHRALLDAAIARARDDQVRSGMEPARLDRARRRFDAASASDCADADLRRMASDHRARVAGLAGYSDLAFPGVSRDWRVDRGPVRAGRAGEPRWRVSQRHGAGQAQFGVFEQDGAMHVALAYNGADRPARAALALRDPARQAHPLDFTAGGLLAAPDADPAASWGAGRGALNRIAASGRLAPDTAAHLAPAGGQPARGFVFPDHALQRLTALTPREGVAVELYDRTGQVAQRIWIEIGALKAALAMQAIALPEPEPSDPPQAMP